LSHLTNKQQAQLPQSIIHMLNLAGIRGKTDEKKKILLNPYITLAIVIFRDGSTLF